MITQELGHIWFLCNDVSHSSRWFVTCLMPAYVWSHFRPSHFNWTCFFFVLRAAKGAEHELAQHLLIPFMEKWADLIHVTIMSLWKTLSLKSFGHLIRFLLFQRNENSGAGSGSKRDRLKLVWHVSPSSRGTEEKYQKQFRGDLCLPLLWFLFHEAPLFPGYAALCSVFHSACFF